MSIKKTFIFHVDSPSEISELNKPFGLPIYFSEGNDPTIKYLDGSGIVMTAATNNLSPIQPDSAFNSSISFNQNKQSYFTITGDTFLSINSSSDNKTGSKVVLVVDGNHEDALLFPSDWINKRGETFDTSKRNLISIEYTEVNDESFISYDIVKKPIFNWSTNDLSGLFLDFREIDLDNDDEANSSSGLTKWYDLSPGGHLFFQTGATESPLVESNGVSAVSNDFLFGPNFGNSETFSSGFTMGIRFKVDSVPSTGATIFGTESLNIGVTSSGTLQATLDQGIEDTWESLSAVTDGVYRNWIIEFNESNKQISVWDETAKAISNDGVNLGSFSGQSLQTLSGDTGNYHLFAKNESGSVTQHISDTTISKVLIYKSSVNTNFIKLIGKELTI